MGRPLENPEAGDQSRRSRQTAQMFRNARPKTEEDALRRRIGTSRRLSHSPIWFQLANIGVL
jgi:hypothetical protein